MGVLPEFTEDELQGLTGLSDLEQVRAGSGIYLVSADGTLRRASELRVHASQPGLLEVGVYDLSLTRYRAVIQQHVLDEHGIHEPRFELKDANGWSLVPARLVRSDWILDDPGVEEWRFRVTEAAQAAWSTGALDAGLRIYGLGDDSSLRLERDEGLWMHVQPRARGMVVDFEPRLGFDNHGASVYFNKTWLQSHNVTEPVFEWGHNELWKPLSARDEGTHWVVDAPSFSQIGVNQANSGTTSAWLKQRNKEIPAEPFDTDLGFIHSGTKVQDGRLGMQEIETGIVTDFRAAVESEAVLVGDDVVFPFDADGVRPITVTNQADAGHGGILVEVPYSEPLEYTATTQRPVAHALVPGVTELAEPLFQGSMERVLWQGQDLLFVGQQGRVDIWQLVAGEWLDRQDLAVPLSEDWTTFCVNDSISVGVAEYDDDLFATLSCIDDDGIGIYKHDGNQWMRLAHHGASREYYSDTGLEVTSTQINIGITGNDAMGSPHYYRQIRYDHAGNFLGDVVSSQSIGTCPIAECRAPIVFQLTSTNPGVGKFIFPDVDSPALLQVAPGTSSIYNSGSTSIPVINSIMPVQGVRDGEIVIVDAFGGAASWAGNIGTSTSFQGSEDAFNPYWSFIGARGQFSALAPFVHDGIPWLHIANYDSNIQSYDWGLHDKSYRWDRGLNLASSSYATGHLYSEMSEDAFVGPDGNTWIAVGDTNGIVRVQTGTPTTPFGGTTSTLPDVGSDASPTHMKIGTNHYLLVASSTGSWSGFRYSGNTWSNDASITAGLPTPPGWIIPEIIEWETGEHYILWTYNNQFHTYKWAGSTWVASELPFTLEALYTNDEQFRYIQWGGIDILWTMDLQDKDALPLIVGHRAWSDHNDDGRWEFAINSRGGSCGRTGCTPDRLAGASGNVVLSHDDVDNPDDTAVVQIDSRPGKRLYKGYSSWTIATEDAYSFNMKFGDNVRYSQYGSVNVVNMGLFVKIEGGIHRDCLNFDPGVSWGAQCFNPSSNNYLRMHSPVTNARATFWDESSLTNYFVTVSGTSIAWTAKDFALNTIATGTIAGATPTEFAAGKHWEFRQLKGEGVFLASSSEGLAYIEKNGSFYGPYPYHPGGSIASDEEENVRLLIEVDHSGEEKGYFQKYKGETPLVYQDGAFRIGSAASTLGFPLKASVIPVGRGLVHYDGQSIGVADADWTQPLVGVTAACENEGTIYAATYTGEIWKATSSTITLFDHPRAVRITALECADDIWSGYADGKVSMVRADGTRILTVGSSGTDRVTDIHDAGTTTFVLHGNGRVSRFSNTGASLWTDYNVLPDADQILADEASGTFLIAGNTLRKYPTTAPGEPGSGAVLQELAWRVRSTYSMTAPDAVYLATDQGLLKVTPELEWIWSPTNGPTSLPGSLQGHNTQGPFHVAELNADVVRIKGIQQVLDVPRRYTESIYFQEEPLGPSGGTQEYQSLGYFDGAAHLNYYSPGIPIGSSEDYVTWARVEGTAKGDAWTAFPAAGVHSGAVTVSIGDIIVDDATAGSWLGPIQEAYRIEDVFVSASFEGSAQYQLEWRSGFTETPSPYTWTPWSTGTPELGQYYQFRLTFTKPVGPGHSVSIHDILYDRVTYPGSAFASFNVALPAPATRVTLQPSTSLVDESTASYFVNDNGWQPVLLGQAYEFPVAVNNVDIRIEYTATWDAPSTSHVVVDWASASETQYPSATQRTVGLTSEVNEVQFAYTESLGPSNLIIPVSDRVQGIIRVQRDGVGLTEAQSLAAVQTGSYFFDASTLLAYVGVDAAAASSDHVVVEATHGAEFSFTTPTRIPSGAYYEVDGVIRSVEGQAIDGVLVEVSFQQGGAVVHGPVKSFVTAGNIQLSIPTTDIPPGTYDVEFSFVDPTNIRVSHSRVLLIGADTSQFTGGAVYGEANVQFNFYNADTGRGITSNELVILAAVDRDPTPVDRVSGGVTASTGQGVHVRVEDYYGNKVHPLGSQVAEVVPITSTSQVIDVGLNLANLKIKNTNASVIHFHIEQDGAVQSEYVLPHEEISFNLLPGTYQIRLDYYDRNSGVFQETRLDQLVVVDDVFYWLRGYDLADIVIEIHNVDANIAEQLVNVDVRIDNTGATIGQQINQVEQTVLNQNATLLEQFNLMFQSVSNLEATITAQYNSIQIELQNTNTNLQQQVNSAIVRIDNLDASIQTQFNDLSTFVTNNDANIISQVNAIKAVVENTEANITVQYNALNAQMTTFQSNVNSQFNSINLQLTNSESNLGNQINSINLKIDNVGSTLETQSNQILATISNNHLDITTQVNTIKGIVENTNATITTQFNGVRTQITTLESTVQTQFTVTQDQILTTNSTIHQHVTDLDAALVARMTGVLDQVTFEGDWAYQQTVDILAQIATLPTDMASLSANLTTAVELLLTQSNTNLDAGLLEVQSLLESIDYESILTLNGRVAQLVAAFNEPHTVYVPAFNYNGTAGDSVPPNSYVRITQHLLEEDAVLITWGAKDNVQVRTTILQVREKGTTTWTTLGTYARTGGTESVGNLTVGATYQFRSQATDLAGNTEEAGTDERQSNFAEITVGDPSQSLREFQVPDSRGVFVPGPEIGFVVVALLAFVALRRWRA